MPDFYFLVVNYNSSNLVKRLLASIPKSDRENYGVVIVNNSAEDKTIFNLASNTIKIIEPEENLGFGRACNLGIRWISQQNKRAIVWLINPDTYFDLDSQDKVFPIISAFALFNKHPRISILGTTVCNSQGEITSAGGTFNPDTADAKTIDRLPTDLGQDYIKIDWVSGCSLLINLAKFTQLPQFCDRFFLYYEDLDFCLRYSKQGHLIAVTHLIKLVHETSSISDRHLLQKYRHITQSHLIYIEKYGSKQNFMITNMRMLANTLRLIILKPQQGIGKAIGIYEYWKNSL